MADTPKEPSESDADSSDNKTKKPPSKSKAGAADTSKKPPARSKTVARSTKLGSESGSDTDEKPKKLPPKSKVESGRVTPKGGRRPPTKKISKYEGGPDASSRYTPPTPHFDEMPSPLWVPILMFTMFALGMLVIFLNYVELLPGATSNWYLLVGLGLILGGIITATQYR